MKETELPEINLNHIVAPKGWAVLQSLFPYSANENFPNKPNVVPIGTGKAFVQAVFDLVPHVDDSTGIRRKRAIRTLRAQVQITPEAMQALTPQERVLISTPSGADITE